MKNLKIVFSTNNDKKQFEGREDEPLGGAWYAYISLAKELAKMGHKVYSFHNTPWDHSAGVLINGVKMAHRKYLKEFLSNGHVDIYIGEREMPIVRKNYDISIVCYHLHNTPMAEKPGQFIEWIKMDSIDKVIFVSNWHRKLAKILPDENAYVIPNGTHLYKVNGKKKTNRIIWASNPTRGLSILINEIFPLLKKKIPDIELHIAGDFSIYNNTLAEVHKKNTISYGVHDSNHQDQRVNKLLKGIKWYGALNQIELAQFYHEGTLLVYPLTNRSETGSIVAVQAMTYLNPIIVIKDCVFPELIGIKGERGTLIDKKFLNDPGVWVSSIVQLLKKQKNLYKRKQDNCKKWREKYLWSSIAEKVNNDFQEWLK